jgi:hypothetical protein
MEPDYAAAAKAYWDTQPHPKAPSLTIGDFATAVKLATLVKFGGHATAEDATLFWPEFKQMGISPGEFEQTVTRLAPISFTYHGRPPTMQEIVKLKDEPPAKANSYFADLPDKHYPWVSAATMIKHLEAAGPHAQNYLGRPPVKLEAAQLAASGENPALYYQRLTQPPLAEGNIQPEADVLHPEEWRNPGGRQLGIAGRPPLDQRNPRDRRDSLPARGAFGSTGQMGGGTPGAEGPFTA